MNKLVIFLTLFTIFFTFISSFPTNYDKRQSSFNPTQTISSKSEFTYYWVAFESDYKSTKTVDVKTCKGKLIATVNSEFANSMKTEGSGITKTGRVINLSGK